jgi:hypothetical protein
MMREMTSPTPSLAAQIVWLRDRAADAEKLRDLLVASGNVRADRAERDAAMWKAVLNTLDVISTPFTG